MHYSVKYEEGLRNTYDKVRGSNICLIGVSEGNNKDNVLEAIVQEMMAKSFQKFKKTDWGIPNSSNINNYIYINI